MGNRSLLVVVVDFCWKTCMRCADEKHSRWHGWLCDAVRSAGWFFCKPTNRFSLQKEFWNFCRFFFWTESFLEKFVFFPLSLSLSSFVNIFSIIWNKKIIIILLCVVFSLSYFFLLRQLVAKETGKNKPSSSTSSTPAVTPAVVHHIGGGGGIQQQVPPLPNALTASATLASRATSPPINPTPNDDNNNADVGTKRAQHNAALPVCGFFYWFHLQQFVFQIKSYFISVLVVSCADKWSCSSVNEFGIRSWSRLGCTMGCAWNRLQRNSVSFKNHSLILFVALME